MPSLHRSLPSLLRWRHRSLASGLSEEDPSSGTACLTLGPKRRRLCDSLLGCTVACLGNLYPDGTERDKANSHHNTQSGMATKNFSLF